MPELPEVETVRRGLLPVLEGRRILSVEQRRPDLRFPFPPRFPERLAGRRVQGLGRRAKYLLIALDGDEVLLVHLGMSGRFTIAPAVEAAVPQRPGNFHHRVALDGNGPHDHVVFHMEDGTRVIFTDHRRFGFMELIPGDALEANPHLTGLGPEPLGNAFSGDVLMRRLAGRRTSIKAALLDQSVVAGLGNIYVCEALHRARLSPRRLARSVAGPVRAGRLADAIRAVLTDAIEAGGSSLRDYAGTDGELGYFQHAFRVYDREGAPCSTPGCDGSVMRMVQNARSTFFCPRCQR